jgi:hypothetical protein
VLTIEEMNRGSKGSHLRRQLTQASNTIDSGTRRIAEIRQLVGKLHSEPFDVVVIDGHVRRELVCFALEKLSP